jgi:hypothetical protein
MLDLRTVEVKDLECHCHSSVFLHFPPTVNATGLFSPFLWPSRPQCPKFPLTWGSSRYKPLVPTTLLPSSLTRTNVSGYRFYPTYSVFVGFNFYGFIMKYPITMQANPDNTLTLSDPTSDLVRQYDFPVLLRCRKTSDTVFVAFVRPLSEHVRRFSTCSTNFSQQIEQVVHFLFLYVFLF